MKIAVYGCMKEEEPYLDQLEETEDLQLVRTSEVLNDNTIALAKNCLGISTLSNCEVNAAQLVTLFQYGIRHIGARCVGTNHIDIKAAEHLDMKVCNASYSPHCVADYTILLMLMCIRNMKYILEKNRSYNYTLDGVLGGEMANMTVGVIGTGRIGFEVIHRLQGFGCRILAYSIHPRKDLDGLVQYVSLDELYYESDIITLHAKVTDTNHHMINDDALSKMKDNVILINSARGELVDTKALLKGLDSGKISAAGIDCFEDEYSIIQKDLSHGIRNRKDIMLLQNYPNVIFTPHLAFYTDQAIKDMVYNGFHNLISIINTDNEGIRIK